MSQRKVPLERVDGLWDSELALTTQEADERRAKFGANAWALAILAGSGAAAIPLGLEFWNLYQARKLSSTP